MLCHYISILLSNTYIASSTDAERGFSRGRLTVSRLRHSLSDESVRANTVLGSWARIDRLVPEKETIEFLKKKSQGCTRGNDEEEEEDEDEDENEDEDEVEIVE